MDPARITFEAFWASDARIRSRVNYPMMKDGPVEGALISILQVLSIFLQYQRC